ncbi:MAG: OB-fold nucleic acid binding domain-containing protein [Candidatus Pacebacteria bacterium]|nr:OB-fold nucleic acid binding domain-containing protein [Candidatus Paceibacterota bacterium]MDD4074408.1 OB-fold nucleic acid binding domain-containing protein [Candidatus Paceibacterota bacterium]
MEERKMVKEVLEEFETNKFVCLAGRINAKRKIGRIIFLVLSDQSGFMQLICEKKKGYESIFRTFSQIKKGDLISAEGKTTISKNGEKSINVNNCIILHKCQVPENIKDGSLPRFVELNNNRKKFEYHAHCSRLIFQIRGKLHENNFLEFNTGIIHDSYGGGFSKPFRTQLNAQKKEVFLRTNLEIKLKQLLASGYENVFEMGNVFRNEGLNFNNSPEFIVLEAYKAFSSCEEMMNLLEKLIKASVNGLGVDVFNQRINTFQPWNRITFMEALNSVGDGSYINEELSNILIDYGFDKFNGGEEQMVRKVVGKVIMPQIKYPTFITELPSEFFPLAKTSSNNPNMSEGSILVINGEFIADVYADEIDSVKVERFLEKQAKATQNPIDNDFIKLLRFGIPPSAGFGLGINRLLLTLGDYGKNIKETFIFPPFK